MNKTKSYNIQTIQMLIIFIISTLLYVNTWDFGFALDDTMMITENNFTKGGVTGLEKILTTDAFAGYLGEGKSLLSGGRYRPISQMIFNVEYSIFGLSPKLWHIQNTLFFALGMLLVYITLRRLFDTHFIKWTSIAFITTLIVLFHPLNTEVVANIKSFDLLLSLVFSILALYWTLQWFDTNKNEYLFASAISLFLGILSKETALTFLAIIPISILSFRSLEKRKVLIIMGSLTASVAAYFALRISLLGVPESVEVNELLNNPFLGATASEKYATILYTWWHYIQLFLFPIDLTHDYYPYTIEITNWSNPASIAGLVIFSATTVWALYQFYKTIFVDQHSNYMAFGWLFFVIVFSISSNLLVSIGAFMNERFIFIANIGWAIIFAQVLLTIGQQFKANAQKIIYLILAPILVVYAFKTIDRNRAWQDDYTLFTTDVLVSHNSAKCNVSAGGKSYEKALLELSPFEKNKLLSDAEGFLIKGLQIHPKYVQAYILLGNVYFEEAKYDLAFKSYISSTKLGEKQDAPNNIKSLGIKLQQIKDYSFSLEVLQYYEKHYKASSDTRYNIAVNYLNINEVDTAILILNQLIKTDSTYDEAYNKLGEIYGRYKGNMAASEYYLIKGYEINPKNFSICENLGTLNGIQGRNEQSLYFFQEALKQMKTPTAQIYQNIATSYMALGKEDLYIKYLDKAKAVKPISQ